MHEDWTAAAVDHALNDNDPEAALVAIAIGTICSRHGADRFEAEGETLTVVDAMGRRFSYTVASVLGSLFEATVFTPLYEVSATPSPKKLL